MAQPPSTKKIVGNDLAADWESAKDQLLAPVNKFLSDVNDALTGGLRLDANLGCQVWTFKVQVPDPWVNIGAFTNSWLAFSAGLQPGYRVSMDGSVELRGAMKSGTFGASSIAFQLPKALAPGLDNLNFAVDSNGAFGKAYVGGISSAAPAGLIPFVGSTSYFSLDGIRWYPSAPVPYAPACFPLKTKCTLPGGQALALKLGVISDVTPGSTPIYLHGATEAVWYNDAGNINIQNIPGLLPNRTYNITAIAYPK